MISLFLLLPSLAHAQEKSAAEQAEALFMQARSAMELERYEEACPLFEASNRLFPNTATVFNLARCEEKIGKLVSALGHYRTVLDQYAAKQEENGRTAYARTRIEALVPRLSKLTIVVPQANRIPGLQVEFNGKLIDLDNPPEDEYVDPGAYHIVARANGCSEYRLEIKAIAGQQPVMIPKLNCASGAQVVEKQPMPPTSGSRPRRIAGLVLGAVGAVAMATGAGLGWSARSRWHSTFDDGQCNRATLICTQTGHERTNDARSRGNLASIAVGAGAAVALAGALLWLTARPGEREQRRLQVSPNVDGNRVGIGLSGQF